MATKKNDAEDEALASAGEMGNDDPLGSVLEFSEDIASAERPDPLPASQYAFTVVGATRHTSGSSGNETLKIDVEIGADAMPADFVEKYQVEKLSFSKYANVLKDTPQCRYNLRMLCQQLRLAMPSKSFDFSSLIGQTGKIEIKHGKDLDNNPRAEAGRFIKN